MPVQLLGLGFEEEDEEGFLLRWWWWVVVVEEEKEEGAIGKKEVERRLWRMLVKARRWSALRSDAEGDNTEVKGFSQVAMSRAARLGRKVEGEGWVRMLDGFSRPVWQRVSMSFYWFLLYYYFTFSKKLLIFINVLENNLYQ